MKPSKRAGLSLLELTVSLALLGLIAGPLWETTRLASYASRRARVDVDAQARGRALRDALSEAIHEGRPLVAFSITEEGALVEAPAPGETSWGFGPSLAVRTHAGYVVFERAGDELVRLQVAHDGRVHKDVVADGVRAVSFTVLEPVAGRPGLGGVEYRATLASFDPSDPSKTSFEARGVVATRTAPDSHGGPPEAPRRAPRLGAGGGR